MEKEKIKEEEAQTEPTDDKELVKDTVKELVSNFGIDVPEDSKTMLYLNELFKEATLQYNTGHSYNGLPTIIKEDNFPNIYNYYKDTDATDVGTHDKALLSLVGWLFAMQLSEIKPQDKDKFYKIGYELGGYNKDSNIYGYKFQFDPNVMRLSASAIWAAMRGVCKPDADAMREEVDGDYINDTIKEVRESDSIDFSTCQYVDLRKFMPTAAGPYAPDYKDRSHIGGIPYPNEPKTDDNNLTIDRAIRDFVIETYNLETDDIFEEQRTVQAIADKDADVNHLFGKERVVGKYRFYPVFDTAWSRSLSFPCQTIV